MWPRQIFPPTNPYSWRQNGESSFASDCKKWRYVEVDGQFDMWPIGSEYVSGQKYDSPLKNVRFLGFLA